MTKNATTRKRGRPYPEDYASMTSAIPRTRCHEETREQYDALGGPEWLRRIIAIEFAKLPPQQAKPPSPST